MRVAFFGGTFDPPHRGHLSIAAAAANAFGLERVLFAPTGRQPLKPRATPFVDRMAMVRLACAADARFVASDFDAPRADGMPNYTVDTLDALMRTMPSDTMFSLMGADSLLDLRRWREPERLLEMAEWIVVSRPGFALGELASLGLTVEQRARIHVIETVHDDVSATELRERLRRGERCEDVVPAAVTEYIVSHGLYR